MGRGGLLDGDPDFDVVYAIRPESAMAWRLDDYEGSQGRWTAMLAAFRARHNAAT